jgi:hypothetical protein
LCRSADDSFGCCHRVGIDALLRTVHDADEAQIERVRVSREYIDRVCASIVIAMVIVPGHLWIVIVQEREKLSFGSEGGKETRIVDEPLYSC